MLDYQREFIKFALKNEVLTFGEFTLKSGRVSPYFFNSGLFNDGRSLSVITEFYAKTLINHNESDFMLFGPAYKGIPLAASLAVSLYLNHGLNVSYAFNRKELKDHGEGGLLVGSRLTGRVIIVDDVITAGTSIDESVKIINTNQASLAGIIIGLDRKEKTTLGTMSACAKVSKKYNVPVYSVANIDHLIEFLSQDKQYNRYLRLMKKYRKTYGVADL